MALENVLFVAVPIFFVAIVAIIVGGHWRLANKIRGLPTYDGYKECNPGCVAPGRVACDSCDGSQIYVRAAGSIFTGVVNLHVCRICGKNLYRSTP